MPLEKAERRLQARQRTPRPSRAPGSVRARSAVAPRRPRPPPPGRRRRAPAPGAAASAPGTGGAGVVVQADRPSGEVVGGRRRSENHASAASSRTSTVGTAARAPEAASRSAAACSPCCRQHGREQGGAGRDARNEAGARAGVGAAQLLRRHAVDDHAVHGGVEQRRAGAVGGEHQARAPEPAGRVRHREEEQEHADGGRERSGRPEAPPSHPEVAEPVHHRPPGGLQHPGQADHHGVRSPHRRRSRPIPHGDWEGR